MSKLSPFLSMSLLGASLPAIVFGQSEDALKKAFEGKRVIVNLEMPATKWGVDVVTGGEPVIDFGSYSKRIKEYGTALRPGDTALVTGVKVKDSLIEIQLAGGGYGTMFDDTNTSVYVPQAPKSRREKYLEKAVKRESEPTARRRMKQELEDLRDDRHYDNQVAQAGAAEASEAKRAFIREKALESGSRFNLRYAKGSLRQSVPTPEIVMKALSEWVEFGPLELHDPSL